MMKKLLKVVLVVIFLALVFTGGFMFYLGRGLDEGSKLVITDVNISAIDDGVYRGEYDGGRWSNKIEIIIKDQQITKINLVEDLKFSKPEVIEELFSRVIDKQSLNVDIISGATVSSKAYLKSMEKALR